MSKPCCCKNIDQIAQVLIVPRCPSSSSEKFKLCHARSEKEHANVPSDKLSYQAAASSVQPTGTQKRLCCLILLS